jgi:uncharacterized protein (TIGR03083 family)
MQTTTTHAPAIPPLTRNEIANVATAELKACLALLERLDESDWTRPTDCAGWTVHDLTAHMVGQHEGLARPLVYLRRHRRAHRRYPRLSRLDADNRQQIDELGGHSGPELVAMLAALGARAIRAHRRMPGLLRRQHIGWMYPEQSLPDDRLGAVLDTFGLRDPWMHRVDLARATGKPLVLDAHDSVIVAQVIRDLGQTWDGPPILLELSGPAGGSWRLGHGHPAATVHADTVDYLRALSGRNDHPILHVDGDHAATTAAATARVEF